jgi:DNA-binding NarL/FixJ family response regulator
MIRVLLIDDHAALREPLAILLEREQDMAVAGQAGSLAEARRFLAVGGTADVAVVDLNLPDGDGVDLIRELLTANPAEAVLVLTASEDERDKARAVQAAAMGVLTKSTPIANVISAIRLLADGRSLFSQNEVIEMLRLANNEREHDLNGQAVLKRLTHRETEVLQALGEGLSDKEIARRLSVSNKTVRVHVANLLTKLGQQSRLQAVLFAVRHGAIQVP